MAVIKDHRSHSYPAPCCAIAECSKASSSRDILVSSSARPQRLLEPMVRQSITLQDDQIIRPPVPEYRQGHPTHSLRGSTHQDIGSTTYAADDDQDQNQAKLSTSSVPHCRASRRRRRRSPLNLLDHHVIPFLSTMCFVSLFLLCTASITTATASHHLPSLSPRELSKRAEPADVADFTRALAKRQSSTQGLAPEHQVLLTMSQPATCQPLNITWDPTKGTPPFTLYVAAELWFPLSIVNIPASYADTSLRQWLFQLDLPSFKNPPAGSLSNPAIFAAIVDSTGQMANTSAFMTVDNSDSSCDKQAGTVEFDSWTDGGPVQCTPWPLGWNVSHTEFRGPMKPMMFPEKQPPLALTPPSNLSAEPDGTGGMNWTVTVPFGTYIIYSITDEGSPGTGGGVGGKNLVGLNQYAGSSCTPNDPIGLPTPVSTAAKMLVTPDYTTQVTTTSDGAVLTVSSLIHQGPSNDSVSTGGIVGIVIAVVASAALILALIWFLLYRRRQKRAETHWEIPGGHSDYPKGMPVDRRFARNAAAGGMGAAGAAMGMSGQGRERRSMHDSFHSLQSSQAGGPGEGSQLSSPPTPLNSHMPYSDFSPLTPPLDATSRRGFSHHSLRREGSGSGSRLLDGEWDTMGSQRFSRTGSGYRSQAEAHTMANAYRNALGSNADGGGTGSLGSGGVGTFSNGSDSIGRDGRFEDVQLSDRHNSGTLASRGGNSTRNNVVVHHDAGLLLDDSLSDEEEGQGGSGEVVELPPQYNSIAPRGSERRNAANSSGRTGRTTATTPAFHTTNASIGSEGEASAEANRSQSNLLMSSADYYRDDEHNEGVASGQQTDRGGTQNASEKEALEQREMAQARRAAAVETSTERSPSPSPPSAGSTGLVDGGSVFDRARVGLGQPDEEFFWRRT